MSLAQTKVCLTNRVKIRTSLDRNGPIGGLDWTDYPLIFRNYVMNEAIRQKQQKRKITKSNIGQKAG